jgi:hypothetical protein
VIGIYFISLFRKAEFIVTGGTKETLTRERAT